MHLPLCFTVSQSLLSICYRLCNSNSHPETAANTAHVHFRAASASTAFSSEKLGDRKPTQLLRHMQQLLGDKAGAMDNSVLRELFLQRLPANVRMVLVSTADQANQSGELADKVVEVATPSVATVSAICFYDEFEQLRAEVTSLRKVVESLPLITNKRGQARSRSRGCSPGPRPPTEPHLCWYHAKFEETAQKKKSTILLVGKRHGQSLVATSVTGQRSSSRLFYISDRCTGFQFLVDTGTEVSLVPPSRTERMHRQDYPSLQAVNGTSIPTFGNQSVILTVIQPCNSNHSIKHEVTHHITTTGPPVHSRARRLSLSLFPGSCAGEEKREPGTHCLRMRQVPLVTCVLLRYTKITVDFCLPAEGRTA